MENMEHTDAVRLQAVEKYILGELTPRLRDEFETHYFDCSECSLNVRAGVAFAAASRQFFAEAPFPAMALEPAPTGWLAWLKPMIAAPVLAGLLLIVGYQNLVSIPHMRQAGNSVAEVQPWFPLNSSSVHGSSGTRIEIQPGEGFHLFFDILAAPKQADSIFLIQVQDSTGKNVLNKIVPAQRAQKSVILDLPPGFREGDYKIIILDQSTSSTAPAGELPFTVAFSSQIQQH
jgi:hypothetical protein